MLYRTVDGEPSEETLTNAYWAFKNQGTISVESSFMLCEADDQTCANPSRVADPSTLDYVFSDWGFDSPESTEESGEIEN